MPTAGPVLQVAFGSTPDSTSPVWTDVSAYLRDPGIAAKRGRQQELGRFTAGTLDASLDNRAQAFDPNNGASPFSPNVVPMKQVRLSIEYPWLPGLVPDPSFQSQTLASWTLVNPTNAAASVAKTPGYGGVFGGKILASGAATNPGLRSAPFVVAPSTSYAFSFRAWTNNVTQSLSYKVDWYSDAAATVLISTTTSIVTNVNSGATTLARITDGLKNSPAGAIRARLTMQVAALTAGQQVILSVAVGDAVTVTGLFPQWTGFADEWPISYDTSFDSISKLSALDGFMPLALVDLESDWRMALRASSPTHWWPLDEASGKVFATDLIKDAHLNPNAYMQLGASGTLVPSDFATTAAQGSDVGAGSLVPNSDAAYITSNQYSVGCWFMLPAAKNVAVQSQLGVFVVGAYFGTGIAGNGVALRVQPLGRTDSAGTFLYTMTLGSTAANLAFAQGVGTTAQELDVDVPHFACVTVTAAGVVTFYMDGVQLKQTILGSTAGVPAKSLMLGNVPNPGSYVGFPGLIAHYFQVSGQALSVGAVTTLYQHGMGDPGLFGGQMVNRVLDSVGWPTFKRNVDVSSSVMEAANPNWHGTNALAQLQKIEESDLGALFMDVNGFVRYVGRRSLLTGTFVTTQAIFGNAPNEVNFANVDPRQDTALLINSATWQSNTSDPQVARDNISIAAFRERTSGKSGLMNARASDVLAGAQYIVYQHRLPITRIDKLEVTGIEDDSDWVALLSLDLMDRVAVRLRPPGTATGSAGATYTEVQGFIQSIEVGYTREHKWKFVFSINNAIANSGPWFQLDDPTAGRLTAGNKLAW